MGGRRESVGFGLVGRTLGHSWSPRIHQMLGSAPYELVELEPEDLVGFVREAPWVGLNVTVPYKQAVLEAVDELSGRVRRIGAANTLVRRPDGSVLADNTDVLGFAWQLGRFCRERLGRDAGQALGGESVLVLGSGGASKAVTVALEDMGARPVVISRSGPETYETIASRHGDAVMVVNTTPVGMYPRCPASPVDDAVLASLPRLLGVIDVVYNPARTGLCLAAERLGLPYESGLPMLVAQALRSSELFQGRALDEALVDDIVGTLAKETQNVALIGMPGAGKTSAGRALARLLGRPFVDLDDAFSMRFDLTPAACIEARGEGEFRALESEVLADFGARSGIVIACGGGVVTRPENYDLLHQNSTIVLIDRPLDELSADGRPLSQARGVERLAQERMGLYRAWADRVLGCTGSAAGDALALRELLALS